MRIQNVADDCVFMMFIIDYGDAQQQNVEREICKTGGIMK